MIDVSSIHNVNLDEWIAEIDHPNVHPIVVDPGDLLALLRIARVVKAWGEARANDDRVRGYGSPATYTERCASEHAEREARKAMESVADKFARKP